MGSRYRDDDYPPSRGGAGGGGGERWDRDRLESYNRVRPGGGGQPPPPPPPLDRDPFDDRDRDRDRDREYYPRAEQRESSPPPRRERERERVIYAERDRYEIPSRPRYRYEDEPAGDVRNASAMVPRPRAEQDDERREIDIEIRRREYNRGRTSPSQSPPPARAAAPPSRAFERPKFVRRQSSLDTYDRKPMPKYGDVARVREETLMVVPVARRRSPPRYRSPPRFDEYEEMRMDGRDRERDFVEYRERDFERVRSGGSRGGAEYEIEEREEIIEETVTKNLPKRGKTKMPIRLVNTEVLIRLDYPFEQQVSVSYQSLYESEQLANAGKPHNRAKQSSSSKPSTKTTSTKSSN